MKRRAPLRIDVVFNDDEEVKAFAVTYEPFFRLGFRKGVEQGLFSGKYVVGDVFTHAMQVALKRRSLEHAAKAVGTTRDQVEELLREALDEGLGTEALARNIRAAFDFNGKVRSLRIARTEMTGVLNDGTGQALRKEGYRRKAWSTVIDGRERPTHDAANGQAVGIDEPFRVGGASAMYPGDPSLPPSELIQCRCTIVGDGFPEDHVRRLGERFLRAHGSLEHKFVVSLRKAFLAQRDRILSRL